VSNEKRILLSAYQRTTPNCKIGRYIRQYR